MQALTLRQRSLVGLTLFAMFLVQATLFFRPGSACRPEQSRSRPSSAFSLPLLVSRFWA